MPEDDQPDFLPLAELGVRTEETDAALAFVLYTLGIILILAGPALVILAWRWAL